MSEIFFTCIYPLFTFSGNAQPSLINLDEKKSKTRCHVAGSKTLVEKIKQYKPKIAVFNGKGIYEVFSSQKTFPLGKQAEKFEGTDTVKKIFVIFVAAEGKVVRLKLERSIVVRFVSPQTRSNFSPF